MQFCVAIRIQTSGWPRRHNGELCRISGGQRYIGNSAITRAQTESPARGRALETTGATIRSDSSSRSARCRSQRRQAGAAHRAAAATDARRMRFILETTDSISLHVAVLAFFVLEPTHLAIDSFGFSQPLPGKSHTKWSECHRRKAGLPDA